MCLNFTQTNKGGSTSQQNTEPTSPAPAQNTSMKALLKEYMTRNDTALRNFEVQVGQLAKKIKIRLVGTLPSSTKSPQRSGKEWCQAVTLRSRFEYKSPRMPIE